MSKETHKNNKEGEDNMITSIDSSFVVRSDKTEEFLKRVNTPMVNKEFVAECKRIASSVRRVDSRKKNR